MLEEALVNAVPRVPSENPLQETTSCSEPILGNDDEHVAAATRIQAAWRRRQALLVVCNVCYSVYRSEDTIALGLCARNIKPISPQLVSAQPLQVVPISCGHRFCRGCATSYLEHSIRDGKVNEVLRCPHDGCSAIVNPLAIDELCTAQSRDLYVHVGTRKMHQAKKSFGRFCPHCDEFNQFPANGIPKLRRVECVQCTKPFCAICSQPYHLFTSCNDVSFSAWSLTKNVKRCPRCSFFIEKNGGCQHMTCGECNFNFCWTCMRSTSVCSSSTLCQGMQALELNHGVFGNSIVAKAIAGTVVGSVLLPFAVVVGTGYAMSAAGEAGYEWIARQQRSRRRNRSMHRPPLIRRVNSFYTSTIDTGNRMLTGCLGNSDQEASTLDSQSTIDSQCNSELNYSPLRPSTPEQTLRFADLVPPEAPATTQNIPTHTLPRPLVNAGKGFENDMALAFLHRELHQMVRDQADHAEDEFAPLLENMHFTLRSLIKNFAACLRERANCKQSAQPRILHECLTMLTTLSVKTDAQLLQQKHSRYQSFPALVEELVADCGCRNGQSSIFQEEELVEMILLESGPNPSSHIQKLVFFNGDGFRKDTVLAEMVVKWFESLQTKEIMCDFQWLVSDRCWLQNTQWQILCDDERLTMPDTAHKLSKTCVGAFCIGAILFHCGNDKIPQDHKNVDRQISSYAPLAVQNIVEVLKLDPLALTCMLLYAMRPKNPSKDGISTAQKSTNCDETAADTVALLMCMHDIVRDSTLPSLLRSLALIVAQFVLTDCADWRFTASKFRFRRRLKKKCLLDDENHFDTFTTRWRNIWQTIEEAMLTWKDENASAWLKIVKDLAGTCLMIMIHQSSLFEDTASLHQCSNQNQTLADASTADHKGNFMLLSSACGCFSALCVSLSKESINGTELSFYTDRGYIESCLQDEAFTFLLGSFRHSIEMRLLYGQLKKAPRSVPKKQLAATQMIISGNFNTETGCFKKMQSLLTNLIEQYKMNLRNSCFGEQWICIRSHSGIHFYISFNGELRKDLPAVYTATWELAAVPTWFRQSEWIMKTFPYLFPNHYYAGLGDLIASARPPHLSSSSSKTNLI